MKRKLTVLISSIVALSLMICSCDGKSDESNSSLSSDIKTDVSSDSLTDYGTEISTGMKKINFPTCISSSESIISMISVEESKCIMLVENSNDMLKKAARRIVLYDFAEEKMLAEQTVECYTGGLYEYEHGVYFSGVTDSPFASERMPFKLPVLISYDRELNIQQKYDFSVLGDKVSIEQAKLSYDGTKIAYLEYKSMYICDSGKPLSEGKCRFELGTGKGLTAISDFGFTQNGEKIVCTGKYNNDGKSTSGYGCFDINGSNDGYGSNNFSEQFILGGNKLLMIDEGAAYGSTSSGKAGLYYFENGTSNYENVTFDKKNESSAATLSNDGKYIISYLDGKSNDGKAMIRISIYSADNRQKLLSYDYEGAGDVLNGEIIHASDKYNAVFVLVHDNGESCLLKMLIDKDSEK